MAVLRRILRGRVGVVQHGKSREHLGQLCGHVAVVDRRAPAAQSALQADTALRARGENQVEAVPVLDLLSVVARERDVVVGRRAEHRRLDVVQPADRVPAAAG